MVPHPQELLPCRQLNSALRRRRVPRRGLLRQLHCEKGRGKGRGRGAGQGFPTGIRSPPQGRAVRPLQARCPRSALFSTVQGTAKADAAGGIAARQLSATESPFSGWGDAGLFSAGRTPTPPPFPGSRGDKGVHFIMTDPGRMKPCRVLDHPAVPEGTARELSPSPSAATFGVPGQSFPGPRRTVPACPAHSPGACRRQAEENEKWHAAA